MSKPHVNRQRRLLIAAFGCSAAFPLTLATSEALAQAQMVDRAGKLAHVGATHC